MESSVSKDGLTSIPAAIRQRYRIQEGDHLVWLDDGETIRIVPMVADPVTALRGSARGSGLREQLLAARRRDHERGR